MIIFIRALIGHLVFEVFFILDVLHILQACVLLDEGEFILIIFIHRLS